MASTLTPTTFPFIHVYNDDAKNPYFPLTVQEALTQIDSQAVGRSLLTAIAGANVAAGGGGFKVKIVRPDVQGNIATRERRGEAARSRSTKPVLVEAAGALPRVTGIRTFTTHPARRASVRLTSAWRTNLSTACTPSWGP